MKQVSITLMAVGLFVLAGCAAPTPEPTATPAPTPTPDEGPPEPGPVTSVDDIIWTWHRTSVGPWYIVFHEDGSANGSQGLETVRLEGGGTRKWT